MHGLISAKRRAKEPCDVDTLKKLASMGQGEHYQDKADAYCAFVLAWSGGELGGSLMTSLTSSRR